MSILRLAALPSMAAVLLMSVSLPASALAAPALTPAPKAATFGQGALPIGGEFAITWQGCRDTALDGAARRFQSDLTRLTGVDLHGRPGPALAISCRAPDPGRNTLAAREAYRLRITPEGIKLDADGPAGVLRGLATLRQLVELSPSGVTTPLLDIDDAPRFPWRGVMIDVARHFMSIDTLKRQIDAMEVVKLNVLHLHLSDNEGFRVESRRYPRLHEVSSHGRYYTQAQITDLIAYAADRGVRIVPEIDVPGHTRAIIEAYPELGAKPAKPVGMLVGGNPALNPASEETYRFLAGLYAEMAGLFPDAYFHIGGDEVSDASWAGDPQIDAFMKTHALATKQDLESYFHGRVRDILRPHGKTVIGWEEVAVTGKLPNDVVVQAWQTSNATADATAKGYKTIVSAGYYLDLLMPATFHYAFDPVDSSAAGLTPAEAVAGRKLHPLVATILTDALVAKPLPPLTPAQQALVLGGEAPLWSELVTDEMLDSRLWPRAGALAERFWSPASVRDPGDMYRRLAVLQDRLRRLGIDDQGARARMASRLAPSAAEPVLVLLDLVGPVRNMAHDQRIPAALRGQKVVQEFNALADMAPVDSLVARNFIDRATRLAAGERQLAPALRADLQLWIANHQRFAELAKTHLALQSAVPVSADIAELAAIGLLAADALEAGRPLPAATLARAQAVLDRSEAFEKASERPILTFFGKHPPADLIIMITPGVRALVLAAQRTPPAPA